MENHNKFVKEFIRRRRDFIEKCMSIELDQEYLVNGEDMRIIEEFKKDHNIHEGYGAEPFLAYLINYYKVKKLDNIDYELNDENMFKSKWI